MSTPVERTADHRKEIRVGITGRPPIFDDPFHLKKKCDEYFELCDCHKVSIPDKKTGDLIETYKQKPYTVIGLARHLGFKSRNSLLHYEGKEEFADILLDARLRIEEQRNEQLIDKSGIPGGIIFDLKNNHGWRDESSVEVSGANGGPIQLGLVSMPPQPKDMAEWQAWYNQMASAKSVPAAIDIEATPIMLPVGEQLETVTDEVRSECLP